MEMQVSWREWHAALIADLTLAIDSEPMHPSGRAACHEWLNPLIDAAAANDWRACDRFDTPIRERLALERLWSSQSELPKAI